MNSSLKYIDKVPLVISLVTIGGVAWYILNELDKQKKEILALKKEIVNLKSLLTYQVNNTRPLPSVDNHAALANEESESEYDEESEETLSVSEKSENKHESIVQEDPDDLENSQGGDKTDAICFGSGSSRFEDFPEEKVNFDDVIRSRISSMTAIITSDAFNLQESPQQTATITEIDTPDQKALESDTENSTDTDDGKESTCIYIWKNGKRKGTVCGEEKTAGSKYCSSHRYQLKNRRKRMEKKALATTDTESVAASQ